MALVKNYQCDLCGAFVQAAVVRRIGVRLVPADRPEDADFADVGPCCYSRPITDVIERAAQDRDRVLNGE